MIKKKAAIITISIILIGMFVVAGIVSSADKFQKHIDITDEAVAYIEIKVNPEVEIVLSADGKVITVNAKNTDAEDIIDKLDITGMTAEDAVEIVLGLIYDKLEIEKRSSIAFLSIGYYSDLVEISEDDVLELIPEKYKSQFYIETQMGKTSERLKIFQKDLSIPETQDKSTQQMSMYTPTIPPTATPEPSPSETVEQKATATKTKSSGSSDGSDAGRKNREFKLSVRLSGENAIFTWTKFENDSQSKYDYAELYYTPKLTGSSEGSPKVIKTFNNINTCSTTVRLSSLNIQPGKEHFFTYRVINKPYYFDEHYSVSSTVTNNVSIKRKEDGSYTLYNDNPNAWGHGEVGVDYFAPTMSIAEASGSLKVSWTHPKIDHEDFAYVIIYASESTSTPDYPEWCKGNYKNLSRSNKTYYLELDDFYNLQAGKTYYFTSYTRYTGGTIVKGNTVRATIPALKNIATVYVHFNTLKNYLNISWPDATGSNIEKYKMVTEYKDKYSNQKVKLYENYWHFGCFNKSSGRFQYSQKVELVPERIYYVSLYTIYTDGTIKLGNVVEIVIPGTAPTPSPIPTETPTDTPTLEPSETPTETPTETSSPSTEVTDTATQQPSETPTETPSETSSPSTEVTDTATQQPSETPTETPTVTPSETSSPSAEVTDTATQQPIETPTETPTETHSTTTPVPTAEPTS